MDDIARRADPETRRALQLDALAAILPIDRRDRLAQILTDDDVATLKHLAREGMGENSLRALASDLAYLEAWAQAAMRDTPALAGARRPGAEIRRSSPVGPRPARGRFRPRHAGGGRGRADRRRRFARRRPACAVDGQTAARQLGRPASLARPRRPVRLPRPARRGAARRARQRAAAPAQEFSRRHPRHPRPSPRHLPFRPARRLPRRRAAAGRLRLGRAPAQRNRAAARRAVFRRGAGRPRPRRSRIPRACPACESRCCAPKPPRPTTTPRSCWSGRPSRPCASGSSAPTSPRARFSVPSTNGREWSSAP